MIVPFPTPLWNQRDNRWAGQRLGTVNGTTIGSQGCLITSIAMMQAGFTGDHSLTPNKVDDLFTNNNGYSNGNLVIWNAINRLLPACATMGADYCANSPAPIAKLKHHLDITGNAILQVGFGGNPANMHFILAVGYNDGTDTIIFHDPWFGDLANFESRRYGSGISSRDILAIHYFGDAALSNPLKPAVPVAVRPVPVPKTIPAPQPEVPTQAVPPPVPVVVPITPEYEATYRDAPEKNREVIPAGGVDVVDVATGALVHHLNQGEKVIDIAGYFTFQGNEYARTAFAKANGLWNGVRSVDLGSPEVAVQVHVVDSKEELDQIAEETEAFLQTPGLTKGQRIRALLKELLAIILSPVLKRTGKEE